MAVRTFTAGRIRCQQRTLGDGDSITLEQLHANGSDEVVGTLTLHGDEFMDVLYVLKRASGTIGPEE